MFLWVFLAFRKRTALSFRQAVKGLPERANVMSRIPCWTILSSLAPRCALFAGLAVCAQHAGPARVRVIHAKAGATGANNRHSGADA
jgi:hypothetical protein